MFLLLGGFISLITRLTNFAIRGYQGFTIDKSLVKKVFSKQKSRRELREAKKDMMGDMGNSLES